MLLPLIVAFAWTCGGVEISTLHANARALGMGNADTALTHDADALFYNPAGLGRVRGLNLKLIDVRAGLSGLDALKNISRMNTSSNSDYANQLNQLYGKSIWSGVGGETALTLPGFGVMVFDHAGASVSVNNPVNPQVNTNVVNDFGYALGGALPLAPGLNFGADVKYVRRTGADVPFGASFLADLNSKDIYDHVTGWGTGVALDLGLDYAVSLPAAEVALGAAWKNVGQTHYHSSTPGSLVPWDDNDVTLGAALAFDLPLLRVSPTVDYSRLSDGALSWTRKLNLGVEVALPLLDIRAGVHEGYVTYGAGVSLGIFRADFASYGVELGAYPGQIEDRRYILEFSMDLAVGDFGQPWASRAGGGAATPPTTGRLKHRR